MAIYNTYKDAVLANGSTKGVCVSLSGDEFYTDESWRGRRSAVYACNPADHLEMLEDFLARGLRLVDGDKYTGRDGNVVNVKTCNLSTVNTPWVGNEKRYVVKAAAYDTETPEEKEAFDAMTDTTPQQFEWKNGDDVVFGEDNRKGIYIAYDTYNAGHVVYSRGDYFYVLGVDFRKPETPEEREEREREESERELYLLSNKVMAGTHMIDRYSFQESKDVWLDIVDETGYRKERKQ